MRGQIASAIRQRGQALTEDLTRALAGGEGLDQAGWRTCSHMIVDLLTRAIEEGAIDERSGGIHHLSGLCPPLTLRQVLQAVHRGEAVALDELALHEELGATSEPWPIVSYCVRAGTIEVIAGFALRLARPAALRDQLTTLIAPEVFDLVLAQEALRAPRHKHGIALILFDVDNLSQVNHTLGYGAGDRLLERLGILARQFFRTHDWVARHGGDAIAVLLPETSLDQASTLANSFRQTVQQRLVLMDHKTEMVTGVTVSAAVVGTDLVRTEIDPGHVLAEAAAAVVRARMNGGNRIERVALLPTSLTIIGAATLLGTSAHDVARLVISGGLPAERRGRHFYIERARIEEQKQRRDRS
jgi:diguanylate cyclase (GGDEF)-like protein/excisionase family DNA binding protein